MAPERRTEPFGKAAAALSCRYRGEG